MNESKETMEALNRGFDDAVHGRVHPLDEVLREVNPGILHRMMDHMNRFAEAVKNMAEEVGKTALSMKEAQQSFNPKSGVDSQRSPYDISKKR